jgi:hypothetical protein
MRDPVGVKKEHMWGCETQLCQKGTYVRIRDPVGVKRNICEDTRPSWCQKGTYVRIRDPIGVKKEHMWGCETQLVSKRNICEDTRPIWCQKGTYKPDHPCNSTIFYPHFSFHLRPALWEWRLIRRGLYGFYLPRHSGFLDLGWNEQDRQCTYNVTLRRLRVTIVAVGKQ